MQFPLDPRFDVWNEHFTTNSTNLVTYQISYGSDKSYALKLRVSSLNYGNYYAWELTTNNFIFSDNPLMEYDAHPFSRIMKDQINLHIDKKSIYIGGINAKNKVMDSLFEMIVMPDEELKENCGNLDHSHYRAHLIEILHDLWD